MNKRTNSKNIEPDLNPGFPKNVSSIKFTDLNPDDVKNNRFGQIKYYYNLHKSGLVLLVVLILVIYFFMPFGGSYRINDNELKINGFRGCVKDTKKALNLIRDKDPESWEFVGKHIGIIDCFFAGSGMYYWENPPRFMVGDRTRTHSTLWYAGAIVHDACHSWQYQREKEKRPGASVSEIRSGGGVTEQECLDIQYESMKKMGANQDTLDYIKNAASTGYNTAPIRNW